MGDHEAGEPADRTAREPPLSQAERTPAGGVFTLEYEDHVGDWVALTRWINRHVRTFLWRRLVLIAVIGAVAGALVAYQVRLDWPARALFGLGTALLGMVAAWITTDRAAASQARKLFRDRHSASDWRRWRRITVSAENLRIDAERGYQEIPWPDVRYVGHTADRIFLMITLREALILPLRALPDRSTFDELRRLVDSSWSRSRGPVS